MMHSRFIAMLVLAPLAITGCLGSGTGHDMGSMSNTSGMEHPGTGPDTGDIPPGESREITFSEPGTVPIHCHPHPFMMHNVTVTRGPAAATHVHIVDGARASDFGFQPENITVGGGSVVTYHNHGTQTHTATRRPDA